MKVLFKLSILSVIFSILLTYSHTAFATNVSSENDDWKTLKTDHFLIHFEVRHKIFAQRLAAIAENVYGETTTWLQWVPRDKTEIVVDDSLDASNGAATPLPYNRSVIYMQAPSDGELVGNEPWLEQVFTHEFIHILQLDQTARFPGVLRKIFGRILFSFPQIFSPKWVIEGLAVYGETNHEKGFGRGQSAIYEAMMRTEVMHGLRSVTELSYHGYIGTDWPRGQVYLYGYYFFEFIEATYGKDKVVEYIRNWNGNFVPWRMDARAKQVFGVSGKKLWDQFQGYLQNKFEPQIRLLETLQQPSVAITPLADKIVSNPVWLANGDFYYHENDGRSPSRIIRRGGDGEQVIDDLVGFIMFDVNQHGDILMSRFEVCDEENLYADLYLWNSSDQDWQRLTQCGRYTKAFWNEDASQIAAIKMGDGKAKLVLLDNQGRQTETLAELSQGDTIGHLDWSPDGTFLVASVKRQETGWNLERYDLNSKTWISLTQDLNIQQKPRFSRDGNTVFYLADTTLDTTPRTQQLAVMAIDLQSSTTERLTTTLTAVLDFAVNQDESHLRIVEYTAKGRQILEQKIKAGSPSTLVSRDFKESAGDFEVTDKTGDSEQKHLVSQVPAFVNSNDFLPAQYDRIEDYNPLLSMRPRAWWIWLTSDSVDNTSAQLVIDGIDARGHHLWQLAPELFFDKETAGGSLAYVYKNRFAMLGTRTLETVQDEDEGIGRPSIWDVEERVQAIYTQPFTSLSHRFSISAGLAAEWVERIVEEAKGSRARSSRRDNLAGIALNWDTSQSFVHSISKESGRTVKLSGEQYDVFSDGRSEGLRAYLDWREFFSFGNSHVLAVRLVEAMAEQDAPNYRLGGYTDDFATIAETIGFGRDEFALRGYEDNIDELAGERLRFSSLEWRIPLFEYYDGLFYPPFGLGRGSIALFVDSGAAWENGEDPDYLTGAGVEFSPQLLIGYDNLPLDLTFGAAYGFDNDLGGTEFYFRLGVQL